MGRMKYGTPENGQVVDQPSTVNQPPPTPDTQAQVTEEKDEKSNKSQSQNS